MGGKGGGGGVTPQDMGMVYDPTLMGGQGGYEDQAMYDEAHPKAAAAAPAATPDAAPAPTPDATPTPPIVTDPGPAATPTDTGTPASAGSAITQPSASDNPAAATTGGTLSSAVLNPPSYWVGSNYAKPTNQSSAVSSSQT